MTIDQSRRVSRHSAGTILLTVFLSNAAFASGYIATPEEHQKMPSFKACLAQIEARALEHRKLLKARTFGPDGGFREVGIEAISNGIKITDRKNARYEAKIWYHNGRLLKDGTQYEISHSWNHSGYECRSKTLIINASQGYTLSTFEPIAAKSPQHSPQ